jgi:hypothetical protein
MIDELWDQVTGESQTKFLYIFILSSFEHILAEPHYLQCINTLYLHSLSLTRHILTLSTFHLGNFAFLGHFAYGLTSDY